MSSSPEPDSEPSSSKWKPPPGYTKVVFDADDSPFDWDELQRNPNLELWAFRAPANLRAKHLQNLRMHLPKNTSESSSSATVGSLQRKDVSYNVLPVSNDPTDDTPGQELLSLKALVPRKDAESGETFLTLAPKPIAKHFVVVRGPVEPEVTAEQWKPVPEGPREQPTERLKHTFQPIGALANLPEVAPPRVFTVAPDAMELDQPPAKKRKTERSEKKSKDRKK